jgi:hypothetical protein
MAPPKEGSRRIYARCEPADLNVVNAWGTQRGPNYMQQKDSLSTPKSLRKAIYSIILVTIGHVI